MMSTRNLFGLALAGGVGLAWISRRLTREPLSLAPGGTAIITGASSGIGEAYARALAADGRDLLLIARREQRLAALAAELETAHGIRAGFLTCDLSEMDGIAAAAESVRAIADPAFLVNNAGYGLRGAFWQAPLDRQQQMIRLHVQAMITLNHTALPGMLARNQGAIINVASIAGFMAMSWNNSYSTTKRYMIQHSEGLALELANTGIRVQALCPGLTRSEFHDGPAEPGLDMSRLPGRSWMSSEQVVAESLAVLRRGGPVVFVPGIKYRALSYILRTGVPKALAPLVLPRLSGLE